MADQSLINSSQLVSIAGADSTGLETNFVNADSNGRLLVSPEKHEPTSVTVLAENIALGSAKSMLSLVNTSATPIYLKEVWVSLHDAENFPSDQVHFDLIRITGHSGGTLVDQKLHDLNDSVPSSVTARTGATVSGQDSSSLESTWWASQDLLLGGQTNYAVVEHALSNQLPFWNQTPGTKAIVLRENQGVHVKVNTGASGANFAIRFIYTT